MKVSEIEDIERNIDNAKYGIERFREDIAVNQSGYESNKDELAEYIMDHKLVATALVVTGASVAGVINENLSEEDRKALLLASIIGSGFCLFNAEECTAVSARVAYYGVQMSNFRQKVSELEVQIDSTDTVVDSLENIRGSKRAEMIDIQVGMDSLRNQINAL